MLRFALVLSTILSGCAMWPADQSTPDWPHTVQPLSWSEVTALSAPAAGIRLEYGDAAEHFGHLRLPAGPGPHPVVVLIHGGCWLNAYDLNYFEHWAQWLTEQGYASWNIEYRRLGDAEGGWPGTLRDIGLAIDFLHELAPDYDLDLSQLRTLGHSAGGHLALWAAARDQLPSSSELYTPAALPIQQVIGLAAISNLEQYRIGPDNSCHASVTALLGGSPDQVAERYAQASPTQLLPLGPAQVLIQGDADRIVSPASCLDFARQARAHGDTSVCWLLPGAGHFDTGVPTMASRAAVLKALRQVTTAAQ